MAEQAPVQEQLTPQDVSLLNRFKAKAQEFMQALATLNTIQDVPPNLQAEYNDLQSRAGVIQNSINWITQTVDSITGFFSDIFSFNGVSAVRDYINNSSSNSVGFIPLLPVAAITAALAVMGKFISDVYLFERKVTEQKRLVSTGISEPEAAEIVDRISGKGITGNLAEIAKPLAFTIGAFVLFRLINGLKQ